METWKDIDGYDGMYRVSSSGNVMRNGKVLKHVINPKTGYHSITLCKNGATRRVYVHRLVAAAFIPNPNGYSQVNHKDERKSNNAVSNLEWCTREYNNNYGENAPVNARKKRVVQIAVDGTRLMVFESAQAACLETGVLRQSIGKCCLGKRARAGGYRWQFA